MDSNDVSMAPEPPLLVPLPLGLWLSQFGAVLLALMALWCQPWLPSRQELEVIEALAGRSTERIELTLDDYVEWTVSRCYGECPSFRIRLDRHGGIEFEGLFYTCSQGLSHRRISQQQATAILAATLAALRHPVVDARLLDSSKVTLAARIAGRSRRLELSGLDGSASQQPLRRLLDDGGRMVMDPSWLPIWAHDGATCARSNGERVPFDPRAMDLPT